VVLASHYPKIFLLHPLMHLTKTFHFRGFKRSKAGCRSCHASPTRLGMSIDQSELLFTFLRFIFQFLHLLRGIQWFGGGFLEVADALAKSRSNFGQLPGTENNQDNNQDNE
jgi:hypothetical protein